MHYGQRIGDMYHSWKRLEVVGMCCMSIDNPVRTQLEPISLGEDSGLIFSLFGFELKEREIGKDLLENSEKWYQDHKDTHDQTATRQGIRGWFQFQFQFVVNAGFPPILCICVAVCVIYSCFHTFSDDTSSMRRFSRPLRHNWN